MNEYVITLLAAAAVTYILTPVVRRFAVAVGAMHAARERDVHEMPTPLLGGFAIYGGLAAALLLASRLSGLKSVFTETNMAKGLLLAGGLVVVMGFVDDRWGMGALSKLAGQVAAGVILVWSGAEIPWLPAPGGVTLILTSDQQVAVTILVVVVTMNAVNFIDGLDGLAAGIVGIGAIAFFAYYFTLVHRLGLLDQTEPALVSALLAGVCIGFLPHNFYPARIFMGDTGSMLIGLMLAYAPISSMALLDPASLTDTAAYAAGTVNRYGAVIPLLVPAAILLIPYADLLMAVVRRTRAGKSVFAPDKKHLQHRLLAIGHSHRTSVLIMYLWAALFSGTVIWLSIVRTPLFVLAIVTVAAVLGLALVTMPRLRPWSRATVADGVADGPGPRPGNAVPAVVRPAGAVAPGTAVGGTAVADGTAPAAAGLAGAGAAGGTPAGPAGTGAAPGPEAARRTAGGTTGPARPARRRADQAGAPEEAAARRAAAAPSPEKPGGRPAATAGSLAETGWRPAGRSVPGNGAAGSGATGNGGTGYGAVGNGAAPGSGTAGAEAPDDDTDGQPVTHAAGPDGGSWAAADAVPLRGAGRAVPPWEDGARAPGAAGPAGSGDAPRARRSSRAGRATPPWEDQAAVPASGLVGAARPGDASRAAPPWEDADAAPGPGPAGSAPRRAARGSARAKRDVPPWEDDGAAPPPGPVGAAGLGDAARAARSSGDGRSAPPWEADAATPIQEAGLSLPSPAGGRAVPPWETAFSSFGEAARPAVPPWEATRVVPPWVADRAVPPWETTARPADPEATGPVPAPPWASPPGPAADAADGSGNGQAAPPWPPASPPWPPTTPPWS